MERYDYVCAETTTDRRMVFTVPWPHSKDELHVLCALVDKGAYSWAVVDSGTLVSVAESENRYILECPFEDTESPRTWRAFAWRQTDGNSDVEFDGSRVPVEAILSKLEELSRKSEENAKESSRALRTPEGESDGFFPTKDVRAGEIAGFDDDGRPAVGKNVRGVGVVIESAEAAKSAAESAEDSAIRAEAAANSVEGVEDSVADYTNRAESAASRAQNYATSASRDAADSKSSADSARIDAENTKIIYDGVSASADAILEAIRNAEESGGITIETPEATSLVSGKSKLGTDEVISSGAPVGKNSDGQLSVKTATYDDAGVISVGGTGLEISSEGILNSKISTTESEGVSKISSSSVIVTDSDDYSRRGAEIGKDALGRLFCVTATLGRFGGVRLGSRFQPTNSVPYVVGIGASNNAGMVGQIAFNLNPVQSDGSAGALIYEVVNTNPYTYAMKVKEASASQMGLVYIEGGGTIAVSKEYVDQKIAGSATDTSYIVRKISEIERKIDSVSGVSLLDYVDDSGETINSLEVTGESQEISIGVNLYFAPFLEDKFSVSVEDYDSQNYIRFLTLSDERPLGAIMENGRVRFAVDEFVSDSSRKCKVVIRYGYSTHELTVTQYGTDYARIALTKGSVESESGGVVNNADSQTIAGIEV